MTDWRDGVERLRGDARRSATCSRSSTGSPPGRRLVLITPIIFDGDRWRAPWTKLVRLRSEEFSQYV